MASTSTPKSLEELLADALPDQVPFRIHHLRTPPTKCAAIFAAPPGQRPEKTTCESHFLAVGVHPKNEPDADELFALAIEVLVYSTKRLTTLFVSKADSTGFLSLLDLPRSHGSPLRAIASTFISWLVREKQRPDRRLVVSLFARAQDQYLFPGSVENTSKHVLDDRGLVKWWCRVLDPLLQEYGPEETPPVTEEDVETTSAGGPAAPGKPTAHAFLTVPGFDPHETRRFFPSSSANARWTPGHPLLDIAPYPTAPPRCLVPHFPDDPKARYLDELDEELHASTNNSQHDPASSQSAAAAAASTPSRGTGAWKSVRSLAQFWEMMAFRQECSSGRLVGFIWVVFTPPDLRPRSSSSQATTTTTTTDPIPEEKESRSSTPTPTPRALKQHTHKNRRPLRRPRLTGPIIPRLPRIKTSNSTTTTITHTSTTLPPPPTPLHLDAKPYARAHDLLLKQDFSTRPAAARSTRTWLREVAVLAGLDGEAASAAVSSGVRVVGRRKVEGVGEQGREGKVNVNVLGVRKRRKDGQGEGERMSMEGEGEGAGERPRVNVLGQGLVRKKVKT